MACSVKFIERLIRKVVNRLKDNPGGKWQDIDPNKSISNYTKDPKAQFAIEAYVGLLMYRSGCGDCPWPNNWASIKISALATKIQSC